ncbi:MAG: zinc-dependent alcohol dehydrogenase family protein [Acidimicrobiales bacterium]
MTSRGWAVGRPGPADRRPLVRVDRPLPRPGPGQIRVAVQVCGVCRTDLHLAEGDLEPRRPLVVPGHEIVGTVDDLGDGCNRFALGDRVGIAWLARSCGRCRYCVAGRENLCTDPCFTGWDRDGGYAEHALADEEFAYRLPEGLDDVHAAPLLCAGIIGYRALRRANLPPGGRLGIYGFGASAHITAQIAIAQGAAVHVLTRSAEARELALDLGAASAAGAYDAPPEPLDAAILFAPVGTLVPSALDALDRGGTLAIAGIHMTDIPPLDYDRHLFEERSVCSVTANTRQDGIELLEIASRLHVRVSTVTYELDRAGDALADLAGDRVTGAAVLVNG